MFTNPDFQKLAIALAQSQTAIRRLVRRVFTITLIMFWFALLFVFSSIIAYWRGQEIDNLKSRLDRIESLNAPERFAQ